MLRYIGRGDFVRGYPARNLTAEEVKKFGKRNLLATGLYKENKKKKPVEAKE
jgi:hypothetical protein